ncbi:MAG TPA: RagB/SusD family nutrient uptake outer membrane protein [Longimicrobiales bacterium]|nr:RagB/SusD family nutrient uptake outer membrane protein [Longimicrobiales bacterium]
MITAGFAVVALGACSLDVDNPTMIEDADLDNPDAVPAIAAGVAGDFAYAAVVPGGGGVYVAGAMLTDELVHVGTWVGLRGLSDGQSRNDWVESQSRWSEPSQARWVAEKAIDRISALVEDPQTNEYVAQVTHWAGHANRLMGDAFCEAVIDGGDLQPYTVYYDRAATYFTDAIGITAAAGLEDYRLSAIGGRAHVRMMQGDWAGAVADAAEIPTDFVFYQVHSTNSGRENNDMYWWGYLRSEGSVWGTPFAEWGVNLSDPGAGGDPRVQYDDSGDTGGDGRRPFYRQRKYRSYDDDIALVSGTEMRLLEAEALLHAGSIGPAMDRINEVRQYHNATDGYSLPDLTAATIEEAWEILMRERGIELWLQGKRLPDVRRWMVSPGYVPFEVVRAEARGQPASADPWVNVLDAQVITERGDLCLPVSKDEIDANPNF